MLVPLLYRLDSRLFFIMEKLPVFFFLAHGFAAVSLFIFGYLEIVGLRPIWPP